MFKYLAIIIVLFISQNLFCHEFETNRASNESKAIEPLKDSIVYVYVNFFSPEYWFNETDTAKIRKINANWNVQNTRYLLMPSAVPLKKGSGYYQNILIGGNKIEYAFTDYFSTSLLIEPISSIIFGQLSGFVSVKFAFPLTENVYWSVFDMNSTSRDPEKKEFINISNFMLTWVYDDFNFTTGVGYFIENRNSFYLNVSASYNISKRLYLFSENYLLKDGIGGFNGVKFAIGRATLESAFFVTNDRLMLGLMFGGTYTFDGF